MKKQMIRSFRWTVFLALLPALPCLAQQHPGTIQVQKYTIDAVVNPRTQSITSTAKIDLRRSTR